ncbi:MAG: 50S ribosomal protein L21 [Tissierellia bacterium]|nr:50S ribosomal protein L21 [Tissierellia bacterium]
MNAIIKTGGKQYNVEEGTVLKVEKLEAKEGDTVEFSEVLFIQDGDNTLVGKPFIDGAKVTAEVVSQGRGKKIIAFKYKAKKGYRRKKGHRQPFTEIKINTIEK